MLSISEGKLQTINFSGNSLKSKNITYRGNSELEKTPESDEFNKEKKSSVGKTIRIVAECLAGLALIFGGICFFKGKNVLEGKDSTFWEKIKEGCKKIFNKTEKKSGGVDGKTETKTDTKADPKSNTKSDPKTDNKSKDTSNPTDKEVSSTDNKSDKPKSDQTNQNSSDELLINYLDKQPKEKKEKLNEIINRFKKSGFKTSCEETPEGVILTVTAGENLIKPDTKKFFEEFNMSEVENAAKKFKYSFNLDKNTNYDELEKCFINYMEKELKGSSIFDSLNLDILKQKFRELFTQKPKDGTIPPKDGINNGNKGGSNKDSKSDGLEDLFICFGDLLSDIADIL